MSKQEHTPGPWEIKSPIELPQELIGPVDPQGGAWMTAGTIGGNDKANARLIASAPELLAAAEQVCDEMEDVVEWTENDCFQALKAAVAKAKGEL